jgi:hypothetical protein
MFTSRWLIAVAIVSGIGKSWLVGQETTRDVPKPLPATPQTSLLDGPKPKPVAAPPAEAVTEAQKRGVAFLLKDQNPDGSWGSAERTKGLNIYAPVPGAHHAFRTAVTSLAVMALIEVGGDSDDVRQAIERGEAWLLEHLPSLRRANHDALYNVWGHAYAIQALTRLHGRPSGRAGRRVPQDHAELDKSETERLEKLISLIDDQIGFLARYESIDGGWGYYDFKVGAQRPTSSSTSFTTATALVAFHEARAIGVAVPEKLSKSAADSIRRQRKPDFSYLYGEYLKWEPMHPINRPGGSLGRSQVCNLALRLWGDERVTDAVMQTWLDRLFARNLWLDIGRKRPIPHESHFMIAAYFFYYGHYYAALCIEQLPSEARPFYQDHLATVLLRLQEQDGSWWDFPFYDYHQPYGTAFALMSLKRCQRQ